MGAGAVICAPAVIGLAGDAMVGIGLWTGSTGMFMAGQSAYQAATIVEANIVYGSPGKTLPINTYSDKFSEVTASDSASQASGQPITLSREMDKGLIDDNRYNATGSYPTMDNYQRHEYPMASTEQGGTGALVTYIETALHGGHGRELYNFYTANNVGQGDYFIHYTGFNRWTDILSSIPKYVQSTVLNIINQYR